MESATAISSSETEEIIAITPAIAAEWLEHNTANRRINQRRVEHYARQMTDGLWHFNRGDAAICWSEDGTLLNGQHRLLAIIDSGTTQPFRVVRGMDPEAAKVLDTGFARNAGSTFSLLGYVNPELVAAMYRWQWRHLQALKAVENGEPYRLKDNQKVTPTNEELVALAEEFPEIEAYQGAYGELSVRKMIPPSVAGWAKYMICQYDESRGIEFWHLLSEGSTTTGRNAPEALRRQLLNRLTRPHPSSVAEYESIIAYIFRAFNHWLSDSKVSQIQWRPNTDPFPLPGEGVRRVK